MVSRDFHLSDEQLLRDIDGEAPAREHEAARTHLESCGRCRGRRGELETASRQFLRAHEQLFRREIPQDDTARRSLLAGMARLSSTGEPAAWPKARYWAAAAAAVAILAAVSLAIVPARARRVLSSRSTPVVFDVPDSSLTPGAAVPIDRASLCSQESAGNKAVPVSMQRKVFEEYRIDGADPRAYEVDYLITPALGGADDIRNLWPQSYSAPLWNARAKDALEDRLRDMVCGGGIELSEAQREIATNWIAAYRKYFHSEVPLGQEEKGRP